MTFLLASYGAVRPPALTIGPGKWVGVQLNYRLGSCRAVPSVSPGAARVLVVSYRYGGGRTRRETLPLGSARLRLRMPKPRDCLPGPRSRIAIDRPFATSSDWTVPGSTGDTCARTTDGGLRFRSRLYRFPGEPAVRVEILLRRFRGLGLYRTLRSPARALGPAQVVVLAGRAYRAEASVVTVTRATRTRFGGRFHAVLPGPAGAPFRAFGAWRCSA